MNKPFPFLDGMLTNPRPCDQILWESEDFVVVPTVGALVPGWILIIPKAPVICFGAMDSSLQEQFQSVKNHCISHVQFHFGNAAVFEHGPATAGESVGCTVDYAHLHVLPAPCNLINSIGDVCDTSLQWHRVKDIDAAETYFRQGISYLYVEQPIGNAMIANAFGTPSQLFRRVVAKAIGRESEFNWREYPFDEHALVTTSILNGSLGLSEQLPAISELAVI